MTDSLDDRLYRALPSMATPPSLGGWCHLSGGFAAEVMGAAGFDWCCIDRQHGMSGEQDMFEMVRALNISNTPAFVRVSHASPSEIARALDAGARGIIVPATESAQDARMAADACRFPPCGTRSWATTREKLYRVPDSEKLNDEVLCLAMVETAAGVNHLHAIIDVPGIDGLVLGPADLRLALNDDDHAVNAAAMDIVEACRHRGKISGVWSGLASVGRWAEAGFAFIAVDSDSTLLLEAARAAVATAQREAGRESVTM